MAELFVDCAFHDEAGQRLFLAIKSYHATYKESPGTLVYRFIDESGAGQGEHKDAIDVTKALADLLFTADLNGQQALRDEAAKWAKAQAVADFAFKLNQLNKDRRFTDMDAEFEKLSKAFRKLSSAKDKFEIKVMTAAELAASTAVTEYRIDQTFVAGQPMILAGPEKGLKTGIYQDMTISLCTATPFLGERQVYKKHKVLFMSGESGDTSIKDTFQRICRQRRIADGTDTNGNPKLRELEFSEIDNLIYTSDLPQIEDPVQMAVFEECLKTHNPEIVIIDPYYFLVNGEDAGNLFTQGAKLKELNEACKANNVDLAICHHFNAGDRANKFKKPTLSDISWAGFKQFFRQWILIGRRKEYQEGSGIHALHLSVGGSAGHSWYRELEIREGTNETTRIPRSFCGYSPYYYDMPGSAAVSNSGIRIYPLHHWSKTPRPHPLAGFFRAQRPTIQVVTPPPWNTKHVHRI